MGAFFTAVLAKFAALAGWFGSLAVAAFAAAWLVGTDLVCWAFEGMLRLVGTVLNGLPGTEAFASLNPAQYLSGAPADLVNVVGLLRVGEGLAIILAAIGIKLALQVIPFTRLGS
ncbi:DUF2523 family protein [Cupriavidus plantarum]|uniref:DUF2523 family protein n=1 Tax=Cupriavidus plantarum TaxID=942865 RepID=UPI001B100344|nr:DUF2523 family protein [Cupriavidus plantarum]CAG2143001.1 hypothetical protein LMG26296_03330 [Cupriavidus plantarum]SMR65624.1 Protein of unknown function [Cupriavidus plantarum]